jgi:hypothetical protein
MRRTCVVIGALAALAGAAPAAAMPAGENAKPKVLDAWSEIGPDRAVSVHVVARDRDDVVRGVEIAWGEGQPEQGLSSCERPGGERQRGRKARFELSYAYPAAGDYAVTVRVLSGGCGKRRQQRSAPQTLTVRVP